MSDFTFKVNADVPASDCLPLPYCYRTPVLGDLGNDIRHILLALKKSRSLYVWGMPGSGKDAVFHAWSAVTRQPAIIKQIGPDSDVQSWFYSRSFNQNGTYWQEGPLLKALRDGYLTSTGRRIPYLILISDFDRASSTQAESLRLVVDSIQGRVEGPEGTVFPVFPGTIIVATANTAGGGDERGRMTSAQPIDASLRERWERTIQAHWMDWGDEHLILTDKFPLLIKRSPSVLLKMKEVTKHLREAIYKDVLHAEFSHRALCSIMGHAQDILEITGVLSADLLREASRVWVDSLPDEQTRQGARNIMDPKLGTLAEGDVSHIHMGELGRPKGKK